MKFEVTIIDKHGQRLEEQDDTTMRWRLHQIILKELTRYSSDVYLASIKVIEIPDKS